MKDHGVADVISNIKLLRDYEGGITLLQSQHVVNLLQDHMILVCEFKGSKAQLHIS